MDASTSSVEERAVAAWSRVARGGRCRGGAMVGAAMLAALAGLGWPEPLFAARAASLSPCAKCQARVARRFLGSSHGIDCRVGSATKAARLQGMLRPCQRHSCTSAGLQAVAVMLGRVADAIETQGLRRERPG